MADTAEEKQPRFAWFRGGFDIEGYAGAAACILAGWLLGSLIEPFFLIGIFAAVTVLFATRTAERIPPPGDDLFTAPTDGIIVSIEPGTPPAELRLEGENWQRIRINGGPWASNNVCAPVPGKVTAIVSDTQKFKFGKWFSADKAAMSHENIAFQMDTMACGLQLSAGWRSLRIDTKTEVGDTFERGRLIGALRLGGWSDLYIPAGIKTLVKPGQTAIAGETILARLDDEVTYPEEASSDVETIRLVTEDAPESEAKNMAEPKADEDKAVG